MGGSTKKINTTPTDIGGLRQQVSQWLMGNPSQTASWGVNTGGGGWQPPQGGPPMASMFPGQGPGGLMNAPGGGGSPAYGGFTSGVRPQGSGGVSPGNGGYGGYSEQQLRDSFGRSYGTQTMYDSLGREGSRSDGFNPGQLDTRPTGLSQQGLPGDALIPRNMTPPPGYREDPLIRTVPGYTPPKEMGGGLPPWLQEGPGPRPMGGQAPQGGGFGVGTPGGSPFDQIFAQLPQGGPPQVQHAPMVGVPGAGPQISLESLGLMGPGGIPQINPSTVTALDPRGGFQGVNVPSLQDLLPTLFNRGDVRDVSATASGPGSTQSAASMAGINNPFYQDMVSKLGPAFAQQRAEALAQAKEGVGNMGAGTTVANALGSAVNRSLPAEQAAIADAASRFGLSGIQTEVSRQLADAQRGAQVGMANADRALSAGQSNQGADISFLSQLLGQQGMRGNLGLGAAQLGLQGGLANQSTAADLWKAAMSGNLQAGMANQNAGLGAQQSNAANLLGLYGQNLGANMQRLLANQGVGQQDISNLLQTGMFNSNQIQGANNLQAQLGSTYQQLVAGMGESNAQRFMQMLLGMSTAGVSPDTVMKNPGVWDMLGVMGGSLASVLGSQVAEKAG